MIHERHFGLKPEKSLTEKLSSAILDDLMPRIFVAYN